MKIVGVTLDSKLSMNDFISSTCSSCSLQTRALRHIRPHIDQESANSLACSLINFRIDYCNSLLSGATVHNLGRLQRLQNNAARVVCRGSRRDSARSMLYKLHWLPVEQRIQYKISVITFNALSSGEPTYLRDLLTQYEPPRNLRSSGTLKLVIPSANKTVLASRAFQNSAPRIWNNLPDDIRVLAKSCNSCNNLSVSNLFRSRLKTMLFKSAFDWCSTGFSQRLCYQVTVLFV